MACNQMHGKNFEDLIKSTFRGSSDQGRLSTSVFDIEANFDKERNLNTSIKVTKKSNKNKEVFPLSDARRIFSLDEDFRMLIGLYEQNGERKVFSSVLEYIIKKEDLDKLKGDVTLEQITDFHETLKTYPEGKHRSARVFHKKRNKELKPHTMISLNPKVDSKTQRRLQCSIKRDVLESVLSPDQIIIHNDEFRELQLPVIIKSGQRKFNENPPKRKSKSKKVKTNTQ